ncbi:DUF421 domain-containing protein [Escherichia coli]|uniref:DUF421 domain-containing protein n=1 Tax=Escherichia coli TaxID=562 RepID=A0A2W6P305_ECOLX|nr:DUF421 domain-containing protein [Escherichia coli]
MKAFDLHRMAFDKVPFDFLGEVALRSLYTFVLVFLFLKMTGRRGVRQMSLFEVLIILTLGSAAGDVAFYDDVPMVPVLIVFITLALLYRLVIIEDGELAWSKLNNSNMTEFEFFMELRLRGVEQLGQVRLAILETNGQISVYFFEDDKVKPGLLILPSDCTQRYKVVPESADYACIRCSEIIHMKAGEKQLCPRCANPEWTKASRAKRVT